jgi:glycosyltransferase involved in cell wall biosynthesis
MDGPPESLVMNIAFVEDNYALWEREGAFLSSGVSAAFLLTKWESTMDIYAGVLTRRGHNCVKYVPSLTRGPVESYKHGLGHTVVKVPCMDTVSALLSKADWRLSAFSFTKKMDGQSFIRSCDLVHYHSFYSSFFLASPRLKNVKHRTAHYTGGRFPSELSFPRKSVAFRLLRRALTTSNGVLLDEDDPESREQAKFLRELIRLPSDKIYPFATILVDPRVFKARDRSNSRSTLDIKTDAFIILAVTAVVNEPTHEDKLAKNPFRLVRLFRKLLEKSKEKIELHIVGAGSGLNALRELVKSLRLEERVTIHGVVPHEMVPLYIAASDLVFVPYHFYDLTFGTAVFEAFACERPVCGFKRFESTPSECSGGFLVDSNELVGADQLVERIRDKEYLSQKAAEGKRLAQSHNIDSLGRRLESIFLEITQSKS